MGRLSKDSVSYWLDYGVDLDAKLLDFSYGSPDGDCDLDQVLATRTIRGLRVLDRIRPEEPITVLLSCQGGDVDYGLSVYDAIRACRSPVHIEVVGVCWSMATWVLQAGDVRRIHRHGSLMIHDGNGPKDSFTRKQDRVCRDILLDRIREKHPGYPVGKLQKMLDMDTYLTAEEALDLGLVDGVVG